MKTMMILLSGLMMMFCSCSGAGDDTSADIKASREAGQRHAERALSYPEGSMAREKAILDIRARETRLRDAGFEPCADAYVESAAKVLDFRTGDTSGKLSK